MDVDLDWSNTGGTPATANTPTSNARLTITQTANNTPVRTTIVSNCSDGSTNEPTGPFIRDLSQLANAVSGVSLAGPTQVDTPSLLGLVVF